MKAPRRTYWKEIAVVLGFGSLWYVCSREPSRKSNETRAEIAATATMSAAPPPETKVTAAKLFADYHANEVNADALYQNVALSVMGTVAEVRKSAFGGIVVALTTSNEFEPVDASLVDGQESNAGALTRGQPITLRCKGGGMVLGRPQLSNCRIATN